MLRNHLESVLKVSKYRRSVGVWNLGVGFYYFTDIS